MVKIIEINSDVFFSLLTQFFSFCLLVENAFMAVKRDYLMKEQHFLSPSHENEKEEKWITFFIQTEGLFFMQCD